jgi:YidC/Oxa1 family membrane protein insertase
MPWGDVGLAIIVLTIIVKLILFPISQKSIKSQAKLKNLDGEIKKIKEKYPAKEDQAKKTMELYKENKVNPFSGCLLLLIQFPIIIALYLVFYKELSFNADILYSFVHVPSVINMKFLGLIDMQSKSLILALLAGASQYLQAVVSMPKNTTPTGPSKSFKDELAKNMGSQMKYFLPIFVAFISYQISAAIALYWFISNMFTVGQEIYVRRKMKKEGVLVIKQ